MNYSVQKSDFFIHFLLQHVLVGLKIIEIENILESFFLRSLNASSLIKESYEIR